MIIRSLLDNDLYKFTMQQAILKLGYASTPVVYKFKCRTPQIDFTPYIDGIAEEIRNLGSLMLTRDELSFLKSIRFIHDDYLEFLKYFRLDTDHVEISSTPYDLDIDEGDLEIKIKGSWFQTILFEVPILAIVSEVYTKAQPGYSEVKAETNLVTKMRMLDPYPDLQLREFGTRRRSSFDDQDKLIYDLSHHCPQFKGTSNLYFAMKYNTAYFGTMAHEWLQAHQQLGFRVSESQKMAFENWIKVYRGDLGIALSDVINTDAFLTDFSDPFLYKLFDGVREDSEPDPINFGHRIVNFYLSKGIDPKTKHIVFSNSLDFEKAINLHKEFRNLTNDSYGIGTYLSNDAGVKPLNMVLKMIYCNGQPVAKISNSPGKGMCESPEFVNYLKSVYKVKK